MAEDIKKQWEDLKKKYELPSFKEMDADFEISSVEETNFPTKAVVEKILDKVEFYAGLINELLQPDPANIYSMHETRFFDENEKKSLYGLYKILMANQRKCIELFLTNTEKDNAEFISSFYKEWQNIKEQLLRFVVRIRESWKDESEIKEDLGYLG